MTDVNATKQPPQLILMYPTPYVGNYTLDLRNVLSLSESMTEHAFFILSGNTPREAGKHARNI